MKVKRQEPKVKPITKLSEDFLDLRNIDTNILLHRLEENIRLRELSIDEQFKRKLKKI